MEAPRSGRFGGGLAAAREAARGEVAGVQAAFSQTVYREAGLLSAFDRSYLEDDRRHKRFDVAAIWPS
jgi:hypothetical protein